MTPYVPVEVIEVRCWGRTVGAVAYDPTVGAYAFEYLPEWVASGVELAPLHMPNSTQRYVFPQLSATTFYGLPAMIADALPDDFGNAVIDAWLAEQGIDKSQISVLDRLAYAGERAMGALTFHPESRAPAESTTALHIADVVTAARDVLAGRAAQADTSPDALHQLIQVGSSAGGARAKAVIAFNPATWQIRSGYGTAEPGFEPWLIKLDGVSAAADGSINSLDAPSDYTRIEYAYHLMATAAGIEMADCALYPEGPRAHFLTRRFDRGRDGQRIHLQSLCALDHLDFRLRDTHSYHQYFDVIRRLGLGEQALAQAYRRMVFNVAAVNRDDHTKNLAFLLAADGAWALAPAYDVTHAFNPEGRWTQRHQMGVNGKFDNIGLPDLYAVADRYGVPAYKATTAEVLAGVDRWREFAATAGVSAVTTERVGLDHAAHRPS